ncbi:unnamed protein product [Clonostachys chloroleuca]|uniref:Uncharacterized protein n=1 Tax=Clonostachys chloroleuca TaxID=1926264 RepID=A0AA35LUC8_9HYPO|nr:unnamed protein product [Clonostachys chloroleuca]
MSVALNAIMYRDSPGALERPRKRERDSISPVPLDDEEENENKRQKNDEEDDEDPLYDEEDEEDQPYSHSGSEDMSEDEGEATGDNRQSPTSNDRTDTIEAKLEKLMLGHKTLKIYCEKLEFGHKTLKRDHEKLELDHEKLKLDHEKLKVEIEIVKLNHESDKEEMNVLIQGLADSIAQLTRAIDWLFGRLRATTKLADAAATVVKSLWKYLRGEEAKPRPARSPTVVSVASFENPNANPKYWAE